MWTLTETEVPKLPACPGPHTPSTAQRPVALPSPLYFVIILQTQWFIVLKVTFIYPFISFSVPHPGLSLSLFPPQPVLHVATRPSF